MSWKFYKGSEDEIDKPSGNSDKENADINSPSCYNENTKLDIYY